MARIRGTYEYDDDDLTPGQKKEGGLHQNLFDSDGNLKGSARFIPDDEHYEDSDQYDPHYEAQSAAEAEAEARRREREREENAELVANVVMLLAALTYVKAKPHVQRFWQEKAGPALKAGWNKRPRRGKATRGVEVTGHAVREPVVLEGTAVTAGRDLLIASQEYRRNMSSSEAQARYLMALAAKAFSEEQLRLVANANIVEDEQFGELERTLAELPPAEVAQLIDRLESTPSLLVDETFDLGKLLGAAEQVPVEECREDPQGGAA